MKPLIPMKPLIWLLLITVALAVSAYICYFILPSLLPLPSAKVAQPSPTNHLPENDTEAKQIEAAVKELLQEYEASKDSQPSPGSLRKMQELAGRGPRANAVVPLLEAWMRRMHDARIGDTAVFRELAQAELAIDPLAPSHAVLALGLAERGADRAYFLQQLRAYGKATVPPALLVLQEEAARAPDFRSAALSLFPWVLAEQGLDALPAVRGALGHENAEVRCQALRTLALMGPEKARAALPDVEAALRDKDSSVRAFAALAWGELARKDLPASTALVDLLQDADPVVRLAAARTLSRHPGFDLQRLAPVLAALAGPDAFAGTWYHVAWRGSNLGEFAVWKGAIDYSPLFWEETAAHALIDLGPKLQLTPDKLLDLLKACPHDGRHLATMLAALGDGAKPAVPALAKMVKDPDSRQRRKALVALGRLDLPVVAEAVPEVLAALDHADGRTRWQAFLAVVQIDPVAAKQKLPPPLHPAVDAAAGFVKRTDLARVRDWTRCLWHGSASVLVPVTDPRHDVDAGGLFCTPTDGDVVAENARVDYMLKVLHNGGPLGREAVPFLLGLWQGTARHPVTRAAHGHKALALLAREGAAAESAVPHLIQALSYYEADEVSKIEIAKAFVQIGDTALPHLVKVLDDPEVKDLHLRIIGLFRHFGPKAKPVVPSLLQALAGPEEEVAQQAAQTFGFLGDAAAGAVPELCRLLRGTDASARRHAADALGWSGPAAKAALPDLIALFKDDNQQLRVVAVRAVSRIGKDAVEPLTKALEDKDKAIRFNAIEALARLGLEARSALPALRQWAGDDQEPSIREAARELVKKLDILKSTP
jgi:HEAT repeat protein